MLLLGTIITAPCYQLYSICVYGDSKYMLDLLFAVWKMKINFQIF